MKPIGRLIRTMVLRVRHKKRYSQRKIFLTGICIALLILVFLCWKSSPSSSKHKSMRIKRRSLVAQHSKHPAIIKFIQKSLLQPPKSGQYPAAWNSPIADFVLKLFKRQNGRAGKFFIEAFGKYEESSSFKDPNNFYSNTHKLEAEGWNGLLVEPNQENINGTLKYRKSQLAPFCLLANETFEDLESFILFKSNKASKNLILSTGLNKDVEQNHSKDPKTPCVPLYALMLAINRTEIDFLSLNMEKFMVYTLLTIPFKSVNIKVISTRLSNTHSNLRLITEVLTAQQYHLVSTIERPLMKYAIFAQRNFLPAMS